MSAITMRAAQISARRCRSGVSSLVSRQTLRHASTGPQTGTSSSNVPWIIGSVAATVIGVYYSLPAGKPSEKAHALQKKAQDVKQAVVEKKDELKDAVVDAKDELKDKAAESKEEARKRDRELAKKVLPKFERDGDSERDHDKACEANRGQPRRRVHD